MTAEQVQRLEQVFRIVFELAPAADVSHVSKSSQGNWDSLCHVRLVTAIESEFKVNIDTADALRIDSYRTARQIIEEWGI